MAIVTDADANVRVDFDPRSQAAWFMRGGASAPTEAIKFGMKFRDGKWQPTQGALLLADSLDEVNAALDWLQQRYPSGPPQA